MRLGAAVSLASASPPGVLGAAAPPPGLLVAFDELSSHPPSVKGSRSGQHSGSREQPPPSGASVLSSVLSGQRSSLGGALRAPFESLLPPADSSVSRDGEGPEQRGLGSVVSGLRTKAAKRVRTAHRALLAASAETETRRGLALLAALDDGIVAFSSPATGCYPEDRFPSMLLRYFEAAAALVFHMFRQKGDLSEDCSLAAVRSSGVGDPEDRVECLQNLVRGLHRTVCNKPKPFISWKYDAAATAAHFGLKNVESAEDANKRSIISSMCFESKGVDGETGEGIPLYERLHAGTCDPHELQFATLTPADFEKLCYEDLVKDVLPYLVTCVSAAGGEFEVSPATLELTRKACIRIGRASFRLAEATSLVDELLALSAPRASVAPERWLLELLTFYTGAIEECVRGLEVRFHDGVPLLGAAAVPGFAVLSEPGPSRPGCGRFLVLQRLSKRLLATQDELLRAVTAAAGGGGGGGASAQLQRFAVNTGLQTARELEAVALGGPLWPAFLTPADRRMQIHLTEPGSRPRTEATAAN